ncbi:hypothetical protein F5X68DRAFT_49248 [Plectosphaerella plurivora]|uniref:Uncharacterized protein n=1 Tax=Plectosphaerella plurivora TaxID=936078 RepID=A0A9P8VJ92_9PEZI|nr:hypothetical protein F5X68DRAFT_49248 [Plectosphaerella plurivora]
MDMVIQNSGKMASAPPRPRRPRVISVIRLRPAGVVVPEIARLGPRLICQLRWRRKKQRRRRGSRHDRAMESSPVSVPPSPFGGPFSVDSRVGHWAPVVADRKGGGGGQRPCGTPGRLTGSVRASPIGPRAGRGLAGQEEAREMSFISEGEIWPSGRLTFWRPSSPVVQGRTRCKQAKSPGPHKVICRIGVRPAAKQIFLTAGQSNNVQQHMHDRLLVRLSQRAVRSRGRGPGELNRKLWCGRPWRGPGHGPMLVLLLKLSKAPLTGSEVALLPRLASGH